MSALYFSVLRPQDRVAVKPHASPVFHAIQYLFGHQTRDKLENFRGYKGADLARVNPNIRSVTCPFTGEELAAVPALRPDVTVIHAQRASRRGDVLIEGIVGVQKEAALAAMIAQRRDDTRELEQQRERLLVRPT